MKKPHIKNILLALLALLALVQFANQRVTMDRINRKQEEQIQVLKGVQAENQRLLEEVNQLNSTEYIEKQARERLQMIKPDEIPVVNVPADPAAPDTSGSTDTSTKPTP